MACGQRSSMTPAASRQAPQASSRSGSHQRSDGDTPVSLIPHSVLPKMPKAWETPAGRSSAAALSQRISMGRYGGREISNHSPPTWVAAWHQEQDQISSSQAVGSTGHCHIDRPHTSHATGGSSHAGTDRPKQLTSRQLPNTPARTKRSLRAGDHHPWWPAERQISRWLEARRPVPFGHSRNSWRRCPDSRNHDYALTRRRERGIS